MDARPAEPQVVNSSIEEEERKARREAVLQRQRELQQKAQSTPTPWENSLNRNSSPIPSSNGANLHEPAQSGLSQAAFAAPLAQSSFATSGSYSPAPSLAVPQSQPFQPVQAQAYSTPLMQAPSHGGREDFIRNAVEFLSDARVMGSSVEKKTTFLKSKGLTQGEIDEAMRRTGTVQQQPVQSMVPQVPTRPLVRVAQSPVQVIAQIPWKALAFLLIICAGIGGAISWLFKKYVMPSIKGPNPEEETVKALQKKIDDVNAQLEKQAEELKNTLHFVHSLMINRREMGKDIKTNSNDSLRAIIEDVSDTSAMAYYHNPHRLPDSPLVQNFPDLKSNLVYAKQIISTATNTSLLDIPKREKPTASSYSASQPHSLANSLSGIHTSNGNTMMGSHLAYSGKSPLANSAHNKPLGNSATKADMNWLYQKGNAQMRSSQTSTTQALNQPGDDAKEKVSEVLDSKPVDTVERVYS